MSISFNTVRVGELSRTTGASRQIGLTQVRLQAAEQQLLTGRRLNKASDDPADAASAQRLRRAMEVREGYAANLGRADRILTSADSSLNDVTNLIREARQIGLGAVGDGAGEGERFGAVEALQTIRDQLLALANRTEGGVAIFGGGSATQTPYLRTAGGVEYLGEEQGRSVQVDANGVSIDTLVNTDNVFGGVSRRVGADDLDPAATANTRLSTLGGARGDGIARGEIRIVSGGVDAVVDLSDADTLGDVVGRINASGIGVTATLGPGNAINLAGGSFTVGDVTGSTAADLGLLQPTPAASVAGADLQPRVTIHTPLADLNGGAGIDTAGGLTISNGPITETISLAGMTTVGDLLNALEGSNLSVRADISDDGSRLLLRNPVQGTDLTVTEGSGTTAADLGWLTFTNADLLSDLNGGRGVRRAEGAADLHVTDAGSTSFEVDLSSAVTMDDAVNLINAAATAAGSMATAAFDPTAPGLVLSNITSVSDAEGSNAVTDLGLDGSVSGGTLVGRDVNAVTSEGVFGHLQSLITALDTGDTAGAERALGRLDEDEKSVISTRGQVGGRLREVEQRSQRLEDDQLVSRDLLSRLEDADYGQTILEYQTLQASLSAQLQTTAQMLNLSLFDFLR